METPAPSALSVMVAALTQARPTVQPTVYLSLQTLEFFADGGPCEFSEEALAQLIAAIPTVAYGH